jgi:hypothetical protein
MRSKAMGGLGNAVGKEGYILNIVDSDGIANEM